MSTPTDANNNEKGSIAILAAAAYMAGPIARHLKDNCGYNIVAIVRPSTDAAAIAEIASQVKRGDLFDKNFVKEATKGCVAIINFLNQLLPTKDTMKEQMENDLPPLEAALEAALAHDAVFIHTSGNFSLATRGKIGGVFQNELTPKPQNADYYDPNPWSTFEHEGGLDAVAMLAEAKCRQDHFLNDFVSNHPASKAYVIIPAAIYGPSIGNKISFWDLAAHLYQQGQFGDMAHAFLHVEDAAQVYQSVLERSGKPGHRYAAYGESMTIRQFFQRYFEICGMELPENGPICSEAEAKRVYDDSATREDFDIYYKHHLLMSLPATIENLKERGLLMLKEDGPPEATA
jgi:nucleoside-diphosphate-sugar epimerase